MRISILHLGLPLDHPSIPPGESPKIAGRLADLQQRMRAAGYDYEFAYASPEGGLAELRQRLRTHPVHGVLLGGGVVGNPDLSFFMEQLVDTIHEILPNAKIMFFNRSVDASEIVHRWFPSSSTE